MVSRAIAVGKKCKMATPSGPFLYFQQKHDARVRVVSSPLSLALRDVKVAEIVQNELQTDSHVFNCACHRSHKGCTRSDLSDAHASRATAPLSSCCISHACPSCRSFRLRPWGVLRPRGRCVSPP